jgi:integrase
VTVSADELPTAALVSKRRRPKGDGSVYQDAQGRWRGCVKVASPSGGRERKYFSGKNKKEVAAKVRAATSRTERHLPLPDDRMKVGQLIEQYIAKGLRPKSRKTRNDHAGVLRHAAGRIGGLRLAELLPSHISDMGADMLAEGLSPSYAGRARNLMGQALRWAEAEGIVARNVAYLTPPIPMTPRERDGVTFEEIDAFLDAAEQEDQFALIFTEVILGLRPGELTGLPWNKVDLEDGVVHIHQALHRDTDEETRKQVLFIGELKPTHRAKRSIKMPPVLIDELQKHRDAQEAQRIKAGSKWSNHDNLVFTTTIGTPIDPSNLRTLVKRIARRAGITKKVSPYDWRRTMISVLSHDQVMGEEIADVAGHDPSVALRVYRRRMKEVADAAVEPMQRRFGDRGSR